MSSWKSLKVLGLFVMEIIAREKRVAKGRGKLGWDGMDKIVDLSFLGDKVGEEPRMNRKTRIECQQSATFC